MSSIAELPLICINCWRADECERPLDQSLQCSRCQALYPVVDGIPVLFADDSLRQGFGRGGVPREQRAIFYNGETSFLRNTLEGRDSLEISLSSVRVPGIVLEIGSGSGVLAGVGGKDYCALDYSLTFLRTHLRCYRTLCASAEDIPLATASCRFIYSFATLEHVPKVELAFSEIDRVLSPGGIAHLQPAWHCRSWAADGLPVRPYRDLDLRQKLLKATLPVRESLLWRAFSAIPWRVWRRVTNRLCCRQPSELHYKRLNANYEKFWMSDSDACSSIDSHEAILFFESRGYRILEPNGGLIPRLFSRGGAVVIRKPDYL